MAQSIPVVVAVQRAGLSWALCVGVLIPSILSDQPSIAVISAERVFLKYGSGKPQFLDQEVRSFSSIRSEHRFSEHGSNAARVMRFTV
jgi:hypothetical protein